jgi:hypothetical protein
MNMKKTWLMMKMIDDETTLTLYISLLDALFPSPCGRAVSITLVVVE